MNSVLIAPPAANRYALRQMQLEDISAVITVEQAAYSLPWSATIFDDCLRAGYCGLVLEDERGDNSPVLLCGYGLMMLAMDECHILNLCIHPHYHRRGLGRIVLRRLLALAQHRDATMAFLEVRVSNQAAIALYYAEGFNEVGYRRRYYPAIHGREDALVMARALI